LPKATKHLGKHVQRREAVALLKELSDKGLVQPICVIVENRTPGKYQLKIRDSIDCKQIENFLKEKGLLCEEKKDYLIIFKP
jgi:hypothetical protein